jgi:ATP-dependent Lhr-like helicase
MDPRRKSTTTENPGKRPTRNSAGRWSLLTEELHAAPTVFEQARQTDAALESFARQLLARYGVLFRDLLTRESNTPKWRDLLNILRRLEARGEIRGGRFVSGFSGEQYALPEAMESLRAGRSRECSTIIPVSAADPMNLAGIVIPGERIPAVPGKQVLYRNGALPDTIPPAKIPATLPLTNLPEPAPTTLALF